MNPLNQDCWISKLNPLNQHYWRDIWLLIILLIILWISNTPNTFQIDYWLLNQHSWIDYSLNHSNRLLNPHIVWIEVELIFQHWLLNQHLNPCFLCLLVVFPRKLDDHEDAFPTDVKPCIFCNNWSQYLSSTASNCMCGKQSPLTMSWTSNTPRWRSYCCFIFRTRDCGFFRWYDQEIWERGKEVIRGLILRNNQLRQENGQLRSENICLKQYVLELNSDIMELNRKISDSNTPEAVEAIHGIYVLDMLLGFIVVVIIMLLVYRII